MRMKRARLRWFALLLPLVLSSVSQGTLIYNYGDQWDFVSDFSSTLNPVMESGKVIWKYLGGDSNKAPSTAGLLIQDAIVPGRWVGVDADPTGDDPDYPNPGWIESGKMHATSGLYLGAQRTPFLQWVSPIVGHINIEIHVTGADTGYQADVFLNDHSIGSHSGSSSDYTYTNSTPINVGDGSKVTLRFEQDVNLQSPTANVTFKVTYVVPEPVTISMIGLGLVGLVVRSRKSAV